MLQQIDQYINNLSLREKVLLIITIAAVVGMLLDMQFLRPLEKKKRALSGKVEAHQGLIREIGDHLSMVGGVDVSEDLDEMGGLTAKNREVVEQLSQFSAQLANSDYAFSVLANYAEPKQKELFISAIENVRPVLLDHGSQDKAYEGDRLSESESQESMKLDGESEWYRHGLVLSAVGTKSSVKEYIKDLESAQEKMAWDSLVLDYKNNKESELTLYAYTVSEEPYWLKVK